MNRLMMVLLGAIGLVGMAPFVKFWRVPLQADGLARKADPEDKRPHVETARAVKKTVYRKLKLPGDVLPFEQAAIYARVQGYLDSIPVDRGARVKAGQLLAKIAVPELEKQLEKEKAELALCGPSIARDAAALAWRESICKRLREVASKTPNLVNRETLDDVVGRFETAQAELELTKAREAVMRAAAEKTQAMVDFATIKAPFDGVVTERWADPGDLIQPASTKILHVMRLDPLRVRIHIPQSDVFAVRADSKAKVTFDELPSRVFEVPVSRLFWALNKSTKTMSTEIDLPNPDGLIRPGMFAHVSIELEARPGALVLPASALVSEKKKTFVYVVREGTAKKLPIAVGFDDGIEFEVRQGIQEQDDVIVTGKNLVSDGEKVRVTQRP